MQNNHYIKYLSLIFFTGAVILSLELIASKILTPFFGISLYIWTAILSVTLIFLAIGYQFGGWMASKIDSKYYEELFIFIPFVSSFFILVSTLIYPLLLPKLVGLNLLIGSFIGSFILLSIPLVLMSAMNPLLISIVKYKDDHSSDSKSGFVLFISTIGSVFGVIFTALVLIPNFTNFSAFILNALFLIVYTLFIYFFIGYKSFKKLKALFLFLNLMLLICILGIYYFKQNYLIYFTSTKDTLGNTYIIEYENPSYYGNLKVVGIQPSNQDSIYSYKLYQNGFTQNTIDKNGNSLNIYTYMMDALSQQSSLGDALILGFGGGIIPKKLSAQGFNIDVVEIDPITLEIAEKFFKYKKINTNLFFEDARTYVRKCKKRYHLIIIDLFFADGIPEHLTTIEFYKDLKNCLYDDGILISNSITDFSNNLTLNAVLSTFNAVFKNLYYFYDKTYVDQSSIKVTNLYTIATNKGKLKNLNIKFDYVPEGMKTKLSSTLKNINKFKEEEMNKKNIIYDEKNTYSEIFSKSMQSFRQLVSSSIPSRILIN
jgi:spermidine synthase/MFS family permease